jgi:hypothetical protein
MFRLLKITNMTTVRMFDFLTNLTQSESVVMEIMCTNRSLNCIITNLNSLAYLTVYIYLGI